MKYVSCNESNNTVFSYHTGYTQQQLTNFAQYGITVKLLPSTDTPGSNENSNYTVKADICSNPVYALNTGYEISYVLDESTSPPVITGQADLNNWIGTSTAKNRLSNSCYGLTYQLVYKLHQSMTEYTMHVAMLMDCISI